MEWVNAGPRAFPSKGIKVTGNGTEERVLPRLKLDRQRLAAFREDLVLLLIGVLSMEWTRGLERTRAGPERNTSPKAPIRHRPFWTRLTPDRGTPNPLVEPNHRPQTAGQGGAFVTLSREHRRATSATKEPTAGLTMSSADTTVCLNLDRVTSRSPKLAVG